MKYVIFIRFSVAQTSSFLEEQRGKGHGRRPERTLQANAILRRINGKARAGASPAFTGRFFMQPPWKLDETVASVASAPDSFSSSLCLSRWVSCVGSVR